MGDPQCENGYTRIANELLDELATTHLSPYEWRVVLAVIRKTYGWGKKDDLISVSQLQETTKIDRRNVGRTKKRLLDKKILILTGGRLGFNKKHVEWLPTQTPKDFIYKDTRPKYFPPLGYPYKKSDDGHCEWCLGIFSHHKFDFQSHHIIPKSLGGSDCRANKAQLCFGCHKQVHIDMKAAGIVTTDDTQKWYRHFMYLLSSVQTQILSSVQTQMLSSVQTTTKESIKESIKETIQKKGCASSAHLAHFDRFWEIYPKKKSKGDALKAFAKLDDIENLIITILDKIHKLSATHDWKKEKGKYVPYPATWLRAQGWHDEVGAERHSGIAEWVGGKGETTTNG